MAVNPMKLLQLKNAWEEFTKRHPKFPQFMAAVKQHGITEGTVIEIQVTTPEGKNFTSNLKVTEEDLQAIRNMQELR